VWGFSLGDGMVVETDGREAADVFVAHLLASLKVFGLVEVDEPERFQGDLSPSSLRAAFVNGGALEMGPAKLTEVRQALEFVQTPLQEAGREAC
jgi:hypothetical protein